MARKRKELHGYAKRLAKRNAGNPGPNQQWVATILINADGEPYANPLAAKKLSRDEVRELHEAAKLEAVAS